MKTFSYLVDHVYVTGTKKGGPPFRTDYEYKWFYFAHEDDVEINQTNEVPTDNETVETNLEDYLFVRGTQGWELIQMKETSEKTHTFIFKRDRQGYIDVMTPHWDKEAYEEARMEAETFEMPPMFPHDDD